jgi:hypothetical protein
MRLLPWVVFLLAAFLVNTALGYVMLTRGFPWWAVLSSCLAVGMLMGWMSNWTTPARGFYWYLASLTLILVAYGIWEAR